MLNKYQLSDLPEFKRFQSANPGKQLDEVQTAIMYGQAIHWLSILNIISPNFQRIDYYSVEVKYIIHNDPDHLILPKSFFEYVAEMIAKLWELQLKELYPNGKWKVKIWDDAEMTVDATISER
jgi:hypothetical protein